MFVDWAPLSGDARDGSLIWYSPVIPVLIGTFLLGAQLLVFMRSASSTSRRRAPPVLAALGVLLILPGYALMTPLGANLLVLGIEYRSKAVTPACERVQVGVLLSGGLSRPADTTSDHAALTPESLARLFAWRAHEAVQDSPDLPWVITGGGPFRLSEAEVMAAFLERLDPTDPVGRRFQLENASTTTRESALRVRESLPESTRHILLATSALHLPRARYVFEQAGFEVCPLALNRHYLAVTGWTSLLPQSSSLAKSESALHEIMGEIFYRLTNRRPFFRFGELEALSTSWCGTGARESSPNSIEASGALGRYRSSVA